MSGTSHKNYLIFYLLKYKTLTLICPIGVNKTPPVFYRANLKNTPRIL